MAQAFPSSPEIIYNTLVADGQFMALLGTYEFPGTETTPSMVITSPGADLPALRKVSGVECVIHDAADIRRRDYLSEPSDLISNWNLYLICWPPSNGGAITEATKRIMEIFSGSSSFETVAVSSGLGALVQTMVTIPSDRPILA